MKSSTLLALAVLLVAVACGGKNKKDETAPDLGGPSEEVTDGNSSESTESTAGTAKNPELQHVVYFEFDKSDLDDAAKERLNENYEWLKADATRTLTIEGHTDEVGTPGYNLALGERRARTTQEYLVRMGIDKGRIRIITYGEERPASKEDSENRRSVFVATKK